jgi:hypothetical protein
MDFGGWMMTDIGKSIEDVLSESLEHLYQPKSPAALHKLVEIYQRAENSYFDQWIAEKYMVAKKQPLPGEMDLSRMGGLSPGPANYLMDPLLDTDGRLKYKQGLIAVFKDLSAIKGEFNDQGRINRIKRGITEALVDINSIAMCKDETVVWRDLEELRRLAH